MADPVKAPPTSEVEETKTALTFELGNMFVSKHVPYEKQKAIANEAISRLAYLEALLKHNEIEFKEDS